jgi:hypothetical protein
MRGATLTHTIQLPPIRRSPLLVRFIVAALIGIAAYFAFATLANSTAIRATNHCTHYTPTYQTDGPSLCSTVNAVGAGAYSTTSTALRTSNTVATTNSQFLEVWYDAGSGDLGYPYDAGCGGCTGLNLGISSPGYAYSVCYLGSGTSYGLCKTDWHN